MAEDGRTEQRICDIGLYINFDAVRIELPINSAQGQNPSAENYPELCIIMAGPGNTVFYRGEKTGSKTLP